MRFYLQYNFVLKICPKGCMVRLFSFELLTFVTIRVMHHAQLSAAWFKGTFKCIEWKCKPGHNCSSFTLTACVWLKCQCIMHFMWLTVFQEFKKIKWNNHWLPTCLRYLSFSHLLAVRVTVWLLVTCLTKAFLAWLLSLVVRDIFLFIIIEALVLLETLKALEMVPMPSHSFFTEVYIVPWTSWLCFCPNMECELWDFMQYTLVCAFLNHVPSIQFATGGLQSSCRHNSWMKMYLTTIWRAKPLKRRWWFSLFFSDHLHGFLWYAPLSSTLWP